MRTNFFIPCNPPKTTAQAHKAVTIVAGRAKMYTDQAGKILQSDYISMLRPYVPSIPYWQSISVNVLFVFPWRKGEKKSIVQYHYVPHTSKPDRDNAVKTLFDVMTTLRFWTDDNLISDGKITKVWGDTPGIGIEIIPSPTRYELTITNSNPQTWNINGFYDNTETISD